MRHDTFLKILGALVVAVGAPLLGVSLTSHRGTTARADGRRAELASAPPTIAPKPLVGVLLASQMATLKSKAQTQVRAHHVVIGQHVKAGQKLVTLDRRLVEAQIQETEAHRDAALARAAAAAAQARAAKGRGERRDGTVELGGRAVPLVSPEELQTERTNEQGARGAAAAAGSEAKALGAQIQQRRLTLADLEPAAPFDGIVQAIHVEVGDDVAVGVPLVSLVGTGNTLRARLAVPHDQAGAWHGHRRALLELTVNGRALALWAIIHQATPEIDPQTRMFMIEGVVAVSPEICGTDCASLGNQQVFATLIPDRER